MIRSFTLWTFLLTLLIGPTAYAQLSCEYTILMDDSFGDGWNLATVIVTVDGNANTYTLNTGINGAETFTVTDGDDISIEFTSGIFDYEITYTILDADGVVFFEDGANVSGLPPFIGVAFEGTAGCPSCPAPPASSVDVENIRAFTADISWVPSDPMGEYVIEYGEDGFMQGDGDLKTVMGGGTTLFNLQEKTPYQFYLTAFCANGDTSITIGPYAFETLYAVDVGVSEILSPQSDCGLSSDSISLIISNYGGQPQSLIPFNYSINGVPGSVSMPQDGFYTGVVGTDSMEVTEFDGPFDFSEPGEYFIQVWTEVEGDSVITNDTTSLLVVSIPEIDEYPFFDDLEPWSGGWTIESNGFEGASWEYGTPSGVVINSAVSGQNAWVTNLGGNYNNNELSYLISPCFDFTSFNEDPRIAFNMNFDSEECCDEGWLEYSIDEGESWSKVLEGANTINWYNDTGNQWWDGTAGFAGWGYVQTLAEETAGEPNVRFRFVFSSDGSVPREGMALDNIYIGEVADIDFASTGLSNTSTEVCGSADDGVALTITNVGNDPQAVFDVSYSINGGPTITESVEQPLLPGASFTYTFMQGFDSSIPGVYEIQAWVTLPDDGLLLNDAISFTYRTAIEAPFREDFENGGIPFGWNVDPSVQVSNGHNNATQVMHANVWSANPSTFMSGPVVGPIESGDTLTFDYRYVDYFDGVIATILGPGDSLIVELSDDCGVTYTELFNITEENHIPSAEMTTIELGLPVIGMDTYYSVRFRGVWGNGDYWLDIDNINIRRCPESLLLDAEIVGASSQNSADGMVTIIPGAGEGPYSYEWSTGDNTKVVSNLTPGTYKVTVTDVYGCQDELDIVVDVMSSINEPLSNIEQLSIAPNPTTGRSSLNVRFRQPMDAQIQIFNPIGQLVFSQAEQRVQERTYELDLSQQNSGMYLIRIIAEGEIKTAKLVKVR